MVVRNKTGYISIRRRRVPEPHIRVAGGPTERTESVPSLKDLGYSFIHVPKAHGYKLLQTQGSHCHPPISLTQSTLEDQRHRIIQCHASAGRKIP